MNTSKNLSRKSIWIYVTDIETASQMEIAAKSLNAEPSILKWSVDTENRENVLRVESKNLGEQHIRLTLEKQGLSCTPMLD